MDQTKPVGTLLASSHASLPGGAIGAETTWFALKSEKLAAYLELTKPRITLLIFFVAIAGFWMGSSGVPDLLRLFDTILGIGLLAGGIFALNQYLERDVDARMRRTESRPLPTGRILPAEALCFGTSLAVLGILYLGLRVNVTSGVLAFLTLVSYLFLYTPLKRRTAQCTLIGAFPGAVPPLLGWAAARNELTVEAWTLFAILFLWQFPHFHAIAWLYREDYARGGIRMLPVIEEEGIMTGRQIVGFTFLLVIVSTVPWLLSLAGAVYFAGAVLSSALFFYLGIRMARSKSKWQARRLLLASVVYLPALFLLMVLDKQ
ncbi:MAG: heme o synthase [Bryobacteraceae bacterium]|nr:heme o synthase [Bryobacteraceae bacterium]